MFSRCCHANKGSFNRKLAHYIQIQNRSTSNDKTNIDVADGLMNGVMGTLSNVVMKVVNGYSQVHVILVKFDSAKVGVDAIANSKYSHIDAHSVPIHKVQATFKIKDRVTCWVPHTQFPLFLAWPVTIHKCQGLTLPEIVVDMSKEKGHYYNGQAYVAFRRVTALDKLNIINYHWK